MGEGNNGAQNMRGTYKNVLFTNFHAPSIGLNLKIKLNMVYAKEKAIARNLEMKTENMLKS